MQLYLETADLDLIANILLEREREFPPSPAPGQTDLGAISPRVSKEMHEELLQRVLARDTCFDSDELEQLALILEEEKGTLEAKTVRESAAAEKTRLQARLKELEGVLERIEEVCVMI